jgi:glutamate-1-semialdehyde 2,1-aminomutase
MSAPARLTATTTTRPLRLGTRASALALAQSNAIADALRAFGVPVDLVTVRTLGDERPPDTAWGEGAFVGALEAALLAGEVDLAVHSAKDVPTAEDTRLAIAAYPRREDPRDALVARDPGMTLEALPAGSRVGTDSPRRTAFLRACRPDLRVHPLHGNVDTRLRRLDGGETDALVLAVAGLSRLGLAGRIGQILPADVVPPAPGQGSLAVQCRAGDEATRSLVSRLDDPSTRAAVEAERAFLRASGGGCRAPIGALARVQDGEIVLIGALARVDAPSDPAPHDGRPTVAWGEARGPVADRVAVAAGLAMRLAEAPGTIAGGGSKAEPADRQARLVARAEDLFPGGVNSPVRAFRSVGRAPLVLEAGDGPRVRDANGRWYIDYIGAWGPAILGHAHPRVVEAVREAAPRGFALGATSPGEIELGEAIRAALPSMERLRFTSSGTEAAMSALRLARGATGRDLILKFAGGYHGHADGLLVEAGSGVATLALPGSAGVPRQVAEATVVVPYNDPDAVRLVFERHPGRIAAIIVEPVAANVGVIPPAPGFLAALREVTTADGALLVFDEVITGFRVAHGGAQARYAIRPDLTVLGKIIGGGLPVGAYGGRRDLMDLVAPVGPVYQAGTLSGHPLTMAAGVATLHELRPERYEELETTGAALELGLREAADAAGRAIAIQRVGALLTVFFRATAPRTYADAMTSDRDAFARFFGAMLDAGVLLPPSQFEAWFISLAHGRDVLDETVEAARTAFRA